MKELPLSEKPYELLEEKGAESLTDAQLLAILFRNGSEGERALEMAQRILAEFENEDSVKDPLLSLFQSSAGRLKRFRGIGRVKAIEIKAVSEIARRIYTKASLAKVEIIDSETIASTYMDLALSLREEHIWLLLFNSKMGLISQRELSKGTLTYSTLNEREIFLEGEEKGAYGFVVVHNHPSGSSKPSASDDRLTDSLMHQGDVMHMPLLDHIIVGKNNFYSYWLEGKIYPHEC